MINTETCYGIPDLLLYLGAAYKNTKSNINNLIKNSFKIKFFYDYFWEKTYQCIWANNGEGGYSPVTEDLLKPKSIRDPLYIVFYGLGTIYKKQCKVGRSSRF